MGYALLFTGQGAQHPGMLPWLQRDDAVAAVEQRLGTDWRDRLADLAWAGNNAHAQVLLTGLALAAFHQLTAELGPPAVVAGYSVGELAAFASAGVFDTAAALQLAAQRAACMNAAGAGCATGLMAVSGHAPDGLHQLCLAFDLDVAIRISSDSAVLGGPLQPLAAAGLEAQAQGLQVTHLNVALASHTRWMRPAAQAFGALLRNVPLRAPHTRLVSAVRGRVMTAGQAGEALEQQMAQTLRWDECLEAIAAQRVHAVLEIGPQQALARMWNDRWPGVPARSADEFRSGAAVVAWVRKQLAR